MTRRRVLIAVAAALAVVLLSVLVSCGVATSVARDAAHAPSPATTSTGGGTLDSGFVPRYVFSSPAGVAQGTALGYALGRINTPIPAGPAIVGFSVTITLQVASTLRCYLYDDESSTELAASGFQLASAFEPTTFSATKTVTLPSDGTIALRCEPGAGAFTALYADQSIVVLSFAT
jgi:hypothetical protein